MLAKRLVYQLSISDDYEELMISKLKVNHHIRLYEVNLCFSKYVLVNIHHNSNKCIKILL
jgi:hypothetical protein